MRNYNYDYYLIIIQYKHIIYLPLKKKNKKKKFGIERKCQHIGKFNKINNITNKYNTASGVPIG